MGSLSAGDGRRSHFPEPPGGGGDKLCKNIRAQPASRRGVCWRSTPHCLPYSLLSSQKSTRAQLWDGMTSKSRANRLSQWIRTPVRSCSTGTVPCLGGSRGRIRNQLPEPEVLSLIFVSPPHQQTLLTPFTSQVCQVPRVSSWHSAASHPYQTSLFWTTSMCICTFWSTNPTTNFDSYVLVLICPVLCLLSN